MVDNGVTQYIEPYIAWLIQWHQGKFMIAPKHNQPYQSTNRAHFSWGVLNFLFYPHTTKHISILIWPFYGPKLEYSGISVVARSAVATMVLTMRYMQVSPEGVFQYHFCYHSDRILFIFVSEYQTILWMFLKTMQ